MTVAAAPVREEHSERRRYQWTVNSFNTAVAADVFTEPKRLELAWGELWEKELLNPPDASLLRLIARRLRAAPEPKFVLMQESPLHIDPSSEPTPDVLVARGAEERYTLRHPEPTDTVLVNEVADSSAGRDTEEETRLYAQAGIPDYWVSLIRTRELVVFRRPSSDG